MQAIVQRRYGSAETLALEEIDRPAVGAGDVLVRVRAASLHIGDWHLMTGRPLILRAIGFGLRAPKVKVRGMDIAGHVEAVGAGVTEFTAGDEVFGTCEGGFAEYARAPVANLALKPSRLTYEEAAAVPTSATSALQALRDRGEVRARASVLVVGASGGVGLYAVQIAKALGATVTGVCSAAKADLVRSLGADRAIDYATEDFTRGDEKYDVILDAGGGRPVAELRRVLASDGRLVLVGAEGGGALIGGMGRWIRAMAMAPFVKQKLRILTSTPNKADLLYLRELIEAGKVSPVVDRAYPLTEVGEAFRYLESGRARGKIVLEVAST